MEIAIVAEFLMYKEFCEENLNDDLFFPEKGRFNFRTFSLNLYDHQLKYRPHNCEYPGDMLFWVATQEIKNKRRRRCSDQTEADSYSMIEERTPKLRS